MALKKVLVKESDKGWALNVFLSRIDFKTLFKAFIAFAVLYNGYRYFFPWDGYKPQSPFYLSILKDVPWAIVTFLGLYGLYHNKKLHVREMYRSCDSYNIMSGLFIFFHLVLLTVAIVHLFHKNPIDVLQRDIKNVQYIFLPLLFPLLIKKERDIFSLVNWIMGLGVLVCIFGGIVYLFVPGFTWEGNVLSTFQSPNNYGVFTVMLSLILVSRIFIEKDLSLFWYLILCLFYGAVLSSVSISALLTLLAGVMFLMLMVRPPFKTLLKVGSYLVIASFLFYNLGLYNAYIQKIERSYSSYKKNLTEFELITPEAPEGQKVSLAFREILELLKKPYTPVPDRSRQSISQYTTVTGRLIYLNEFSEYIKSASTKDILFGDFSLKHYIEYDNVYFYFMRNDGIIVTVLLVILLGSGFFTGLRKYRLFCEAGNSRMAGLSLGIAAFLLTSIVIQFNLSYFLTIYPLNFLTYFFLILIFFVTPLEDSKNYI